MRMKDHKMLAEFLASEIEGSISNIYVKAFVLGNIEPDCNPFTYLHGWLLGRKLHGHNYENILPVMRKMFCSLQKKECFGIQEYYHLGKLIHYVADAFTFPHNQVFEGNLRTHCEYERNLHKKFECMLKKQKNIFQTETLIQGFHNIEILHEKYMHEAGTREGDCKYIMQATRQVFRAEYQNVHYRETIKNERLVG